MREDLLEPQANVDWAVAQIDVLRDRLNAWKDSTPYSVVREADGETGYEFLKVREIIPLPQVIAVETGIIIHAMRSALDHLAVRLAQRHGHVRPKNVYFPISRSVEVFNCDGLKKMWALSEIHQRIIQDLKPYEGGDNLLAALHQLDIMRKHSRLIAVGGTFRQLSIVQYGDLELAPEWLFTGEFKDGTPLARVQITEPRAHPNLTCQVVFDETAYAKNRHIITALREFAARVTDIIRLFDAL